MDGSFAIGRWSGAAAGRGQEVPFLGEGFQCNGLRFNDYHQLKERKLELYNRYSSLEPQRLAPNVVHWLSTLLGVSTKV